MSFGILTIITADGRRQTAPIDKPMLRIGRDPANDVVIDDPSVSGYHARIFAGPAGLAVLDIGSRNGTLVDGRPISARTMLGPASQIRVGTATLTVAGPGITSATGSVDPPAGGFVLPTFPDAPPATGPTAAGATAVGVATAGVAAAGATGAPGTTRADGPPLVRLELVPPLAKADISTGGPAVLSYSATVQNLSRFVDRLDVSIDGPPWAVAVVDPPFHNLMPGQTGQSRVTLSVPRGPESSAGEHTIELVVRSQKRSELRFNAASTLTVTPFTDFRFELLEPKVRTAWIGGRFRVLVTNLSNRALPYNLEGANTDGALSFRFEPDPIELRAGERGESVMRARFGITRLFGAQKTYDFTVSGEPLDQSAPIQQAQGRFVQRPPLPPWMLIAGAVLSLLALLLACSSLLFRSRGPIEGFFRGLFALPAPTVTAVVTTLPTVDIAGTTGAVQEEAAETQAAVSSALAQSAEAAKNQNSETQTAVGVAGAATQGALQTVAAGTQTAAASQAAATGTAQASQAAATQAAAATQFAATATAQANGTGTAIAATLTAQARIVTVQPPGPTTPTATQPPGPAAGQLITFQRLRGIPVNARVPVVGDEYAGQDAFFCFYRPESVSSDLGYAPLRVRYARQPAPVGVTISDVRALEGSTGGTTNFVFNVTWVVTPTIVVRGVDALPARQGNVLTVQFATADGGAQDIAPASSPGDYLPQTGTAVLVLQEGSNRADTTITIAVNADLDFEPDEAFSVSLSNPSQPVTIADGLGIGAIVNDDLPPTFTPTPTNTPTATPPTPTISVTPTFTSTPVPEPPPSGDGFNCQPPAPSGTSLRLLRAVVYPPPVQAANNAPLHSLTTDGAEGQLISDAIAVVNFQRNVAEVNVDVWYPGGEAAAYVMFAFDERGALIATARRDAIGVPSAYQLNIRSLERPVRQVVIEARREFGGEFSGSYDYAPVVPPLLTRVEFRYTNP